jgi:hypothetical protein
LFSFNKEHDFMLKEAEGTLGKRVYTLFSTTLSNHSFILYCWLSEKKQDCRNAEMKKKKKKEILIITHRFLPNRDHKEQISFFLFFKDNSPSLRFFTFYVYVCFNSNVLNLRTFLFLLLYFLFWFESQMKQNRCRCVKREKEAVGVRATDTGLILFENNK